MTITKIRYQVLLDADVSEKFEAFCRRAKATKSDILAFAIVAYLEQRGETEIDRRYCKRLDGLSGGHEQILRAVGRVRSDAEMILESLALLLRFTIALNANKPLPDKATVADANERYLQFVDQIGQLMATGKKPGKEAEKEGA